VSRTGLVEVHVRDLDEQLATAWHGIARIDGQIHDDLLHLTRIRPDAAELPAGTHRQLDALVDQPAKHGFNARDDRAQLDDLGLQQLLSTERQQLLSERCGAHTGALDLLHLRPARVARLHALEQQVAVAENDRE
jgi:hypothetical protein